MEKKKKIGKIVLNIFLQLVILVAVLAIAFKIYANNYYRADVIEIAEIASSVGQSVITYQDEDGMCFVPSDKDFKAVIVFYPGGKVEYTSYSGLMYALADRGYVCLLPRMPENLAFFRINAAQLLQNKYPEAVEKVNGLKWYIAGHSLGGVAASKFMSEHVDEYAGLILCASYPASDFSQTDIRLLAIYGSEDKVIKWENFEESRAKWPTDSKECVIEGGIHSYFGSYGIQKGDGEPTITNEEQIYQAADLIEQFCEGN